MRPAAGIGPVEITGWTRGAKIEKIRTWVVGCPTHYANDAANTLDSFRPSQLKHPLSK